MPDKAAHQVSDVPIDRRSLLALGGVSLLGASAGGGSAAPLRQLDSWEDFVSDFDAMWTRNRIYTLQVARAMPSDRFGFRPVPETRSFAEQLLHIAGSNYGFASVIRGSNLPETPDFSPDGKAPEVILEILDGSFDQFLDLLTSGPATRFEERVRWARPTGGESTHSKRGVALTAWHHVAHHRGQLVIYLRLNGVEPPAYVD